MFGIDPRIIAIVCVAFIALGIFNIFRGRKTLLQAQARGQNVAWHEQMGILTGIEYILLACAFLLSLSLTYRWLPGSLNVIIGPLYLLALLAAAILAAFVLYRNFTLSRRNRANQATQGTTAQIREDEDLDGAYPRSGLTPEERARKRRERRRKAAEARRRRSGKA
jgi:uncharacterized membrane protein HdeD (DUF308 family)